MCKPLYQQVQREAVDRGAGYIYDRSFVGKLMLRWLNAPLSFDASSEVSELSREPQHDSQHGIVPFRLVRREESTLKRPPEKPRGSRCADKTPLLTTSPVA